MRGVTAAKFLLISNFNDVILITLNINVEFGHICNQYRNNYMLYLDIRSSPIADLSGEVSINTLTDQNREMFLM